MKKLLLLNILLIGALASMINTAKAQVCTIKCPANITVPATLNQCGAVVNYPAATTSGACGALSYSVPSGSFFPVGTTTVTVSTAGASCTFTVTVVDTQGPTISNISATPDSLWPPNHKMVTVNVRYTSTDNCPGPITCGLRVTSNEPENSTGDGNTAPDWMILNNQTVQLRAERKGNGSGRIYTIWITCTDQRGNPSTMTTNVVVVHDQSGKTKTRSENGVGNIPTEQVIATGLQVKALNNPGRGAFTLNIRSDDRREKVNVKLFDLSGRMVESRNNINPGEVITIGAQLRAGTYLAEVRQGNAYVKLKLVRL